MPAALPERAVERLFARFAAMYGDAAMKRMWGQQEPEAVKAVWADALGRFDVGGIMGGLRNTEESGKTYPPTLPEFIDACRRKHGTMPAEHRPLLPPRPLTADEMATAKSLSSSIRRAVVEHKPTRDPAEWAFRVIERYRGGDKVVAHCSHAFAIDALHNLGRE